MMTGYRADSVSSIIVRTPASKRADSIIGGLNRCQSPSHPAMVALYRWSLLASPLFCSSGYASGKALCEIAYPNGVVVRVTSGMTLDQLRLMVTAPLLFSSCPQIRLQHVTGLIFGIYHWCTEVLALFAEFYQRVYRYYYYHQYCIGFLPYPTKHSIRPRFLLFLHTLR